MSIYDDIQRDAAKIKIIKEQKQTAEAARDAISAKLTRVQGLITDLGTTPSLSKLLTFLKALKEILIKD